MKSKDLLLLEDIYISMYSKNIIVEDNILNPDELIDYLMTPVNSDIRLSDDEKSLFRKWVSRDIKRKIASEPTPFRSYDPQKGAPEWHKSVKDGKVFKLPFSAEEGNYLTNILGNLIRDALLYFKAIDAKEKSKVLKITLQDASQRYKKIFAGNPKENVDYKVVMKFNDGFKIVKLLTALGYSYQGEEASNCVSPEMCELGNDEIYGLWNPNNKAKATIGLEPNTNKILELAAFSEKYAPYLFAFIKANNLIPTGPFVIGDEIFDDFPEYHEYLSLKGIG
jgi:hypothetical protein